MSVRLQVVEGLCKHARAYDEWRVRAKVYDASEPEPQLSMAYYEALLDAVPPERINVPVLMHALLEQVRVYLCPLSISTSMSTRLSWCMPC